MKKVVQGLRVYCSEVEGSIYPFDTRLAAFIASDDAEMITGQMILCDGGGYLH